MDIPKEVLWYGKNESPAEAKTMRAGSLQMTFEEGGLRNIRIGKVEVLRMIYMAVRDHNWGTILPETRDFKILESQDSFQLSFENIYEKGDVNFRFQVSIVGMENQINFEIEGEALTEFRTNRVGFCVLHPIKECAGNPCEITSPEGKKERKIFPELISPQQPMKDISGMSWSPGSNIKAQLNFEGEVFEMEDQRNWTDESYKTYCRPLELPFPFTLKKGDKIHQSIKLEVNDAENSRADDKSPYRLNYDQNIKYPLPSFGIGQPHSKPSLDPAEIDLIRNAGFDYYDIQVIFEDSWISEIENAIDEAKSLELQLGLKVTFSTNYLIEIRQLSNILERQKGNIHSILILEADKVVTSGAFVYEIVEVLRSAFPGIKIGGGTAGFFTELNRNRIQSKDLDFISYSVNPQVHAFDNLSLVENLNGQSETVRSAKVIADGRAIHVRPVTFKMQTNPAATSKESNASDQIDPRQMSLFGAGWTLGSIRHLTMSGADSITYYETIGEKGVIMGENLPKYPVIFKVAEGAVYPMYYVFLEILKHKKGHCFSVLTSHPTEFDGLVLEEDDKKTFLLANYTNRQIEVEVDGIPPQSMVKKLDEKSALRAMYEHEDYLKSPFCEFKFDQPITTIKMRPYALVIINE